MKSEDLRKGNLIEYGGIKEVESLPLEMVTLKGYKNGKEVSIHNIDPLELSPALLEGMGFEKVTGTSDEYRKGRLLFQVAIYQKGYKVNVYIGGEYLGHYEHVHQLQNLFYSLTGQELIYDIKKEV